MKHRDVDGPTMIAVEKIQDLVRASDDLARARGTRVITVVYAVDPDSGDVTASVLGGCCQYHTIRALTEAIAIVAGAGREEEDHYGLDDEDGHGSIQ
jgi:hypothetical protein